MKVLILGTHPLVYQPSMHLYCSFLTQACSKCFKTEVYTPRSLFLNSITAKSPFKKWLSYIDQYLITMLELLILQYRYDVIISADHSNAIGLMLVQRSKTISMVHDTIAIRSALGGIKDLGSAGITGKILQSLISKSLKRCRLLFSNPAPVSEELYDMGVRADIVVTGCPFDSKRFQFNSVETSDHPFPDHRQYVLNVGSDTTRKRKKKLLEMWAHYEQIDNHLWLVLAGNTDRVSRDMIISLNLKRVVVLDSVSDSHLTSLYANCRALVVSSSYEGFCIPILEALAFERIVFTPADTDFFTRVFGACVRPEISFDSSGAKMIMAHLNDKPVGYEVERQALLDKYSFENLSNVVVSAVSSIAGKKA